MSGLPLLSVYRTGRHDHAAERDSDLYGVRTGSERPDDDETGETVDNLYLEVFYEWARVAHPEIVNEFDRLSKVDDEQPMN